jgi:acyl-coenzyme A synthetase/AMP-(fatty) acid ligase
MLQFIGAKRDKDGYIWITGRVDDMLNVSGHLLSTAQVESALIEHKAVAESAGTGKLAKLLDLYDMHDVKLMYGNRF